MPLSNLLDCCSSLAYSSVGMRNDTLESTNAIAINNGAELVGASRKLGVDRLASVQKYIVPVFVIVLEI